FDPDTGQTSTLRSKEEAHDYRYFPEPDLPPLRVDSAFVTRLEAALPELPSAIRARWVSAGVPAALAQTLTQHPGYVRFFEALCAKYPNRVKAANWMATEVLRGAEVHGLDATFTVTPDQVAELLDLVERGEISGKQAKDVYAAIERTDRMPRQIVEEQIGRARLNSSHVKISYAVFCLKKKRERHST